MNREHVIAGVIVILIVGFVFYGIVWFDGIIDENREIKKTLCEKHNFTYVFKDKSAFIQNSCHNIEDGLIQFYDVYKLDGVNYLMKGDRI